MASGFVGLTGIALVSYNTYPGWHERLAAQELMRSWTRDQPDPRAQVQLARALLAFMAEAAVPRPETPYRRGLQQLADTTWAETFTSGQALRGQAGNSGFGLVQSGALEASNVDITTQLVNMITAQRNFQANAQMISTADQVTQTIINIR